jgi:hypothetical protein
VLRWQDEAFLSFCATGSGQALLSLFCAFQEASHPGTSHAPSLVLMRRQHNHLLNSHTSFKWLIVPVR